MPLDADLRHDPGALAAAVRGDTRALFVCNPNNPTGTHIAGAAVRSLIERVPDEVLVVIDEAYHEYVQSPDYESMLLVATERDNVVVTRTFSKVYGLAGLRVGYAVTNPELIAELRKVQAPFSVSDLAQAAAIEALRHQERVEERVRRNTAALEKFHVELEAAWHRAPGQPGEFGLDPARRGRAAPLPGAVAPRGDRASHVAGMVAGHRGHRGREHPVLLRSRLGTR